MKLQGLKNLLLKSLCYAVVDTDVLRKGKLGGIDVVYLGGHKVEAPELGNLKAEAQFFNETRLKQIIFGSLREQAQEMMFKKSKTTDDIMFGKAMLLCLETQENIVKLLKDI